MAKSPTLTTGPVNRVRNRWFNTSSVGTKVFGQSLTKQEFREECDVNLILSRYQDAPPKPWGSPPVLRFGDFADAPDFLAAQLLVKEAEDLYNSMPVQVRDRFGHNPANFLQFVHDPKNRDEAKRLGILRPEPAAQAAPPAAPPPAEPTK